MAVTRVTCDGKQALPTPQYGNARTQATNATRFPAQAIAGLAVVLITEVASHTN